MFSLLWNGRVCNGNGLCGNEKTNMGDFVVCELDRYPNN